MESVTRIGQFGVNKVYVYTKHRWYYYNNIQYVTCIERLLNGDSDYIFSDRFYLGEDTPQTVKFDNSLLGYRLAVVNNWSLNDWLKELEHMKGLKGQTKQ